VWVIPKYGKYEWKTGVDGRRCNGSWVMMGLVQDAE